MLPTSSSRHALVSPALPDREPLRRQRQRLALLQNQPRERRRQLRPQRHPAIALIRKVIQLRRDLFPSLPREQFLALQHRRVELVEPENLRALSKVSKQPRPLSHLLRREISRPLRRLQIDRRPLRPALARARRIHRRRRPSAVAPSRRRRARSRPPRPSRRDSRPRRRRARPRALPSRPHRASRAQPRARRDESRAHRRRRARASRSAARSIARARLETRIVDRPTPRNLFARFDRRSRDRSIERAIARAENLTWIAIDGSIAHYDANAAPSNARSTRRAREREDEFSSHRVERRARETRAGRDARGARK